MRHLLNVCRDMVIMVLSADLLYLSLAGGWTDGNLCVLVTELALLYTVLSTSTFLFGFDLALLFKEFGVRGGPGE